MHHHAPGVVSQEINLPGVRLSVPLDFLLFHWLIRAQCLSRVFYLCPAFLYLYMPPLQANTKAEFSFQFETRSLPAKMLAIDPAGSPAARFYRLIHLTQKHVSG